MSNLQSRTVLSEEDLQKINKLLYAVQMRDIKQLESLLKSGISPDHIPSFAAEGHTVLQAAVRMARGQEVEELLKYSCIPNLKDRCGRSLMHLASMTDSTQIVELIWCKGDGYRDINLQDENGDTPLHLACQTGNVRMIDYLIVAGAKLDIRNKLGFRPIDHTYVANYM